MFAPFRAARKTYARFAALTVTALALSACEPVSMGGGSGPSIDTTSPVPVALLVPAGSPDGGAILARSLENAARMAIADLDGVKIDLRVYDTAGQPGAAAQVATQAVNEGAKIIIGPVSHRPQTQPAWLLPLGA